MAEQRLLLGLDVSTTSAKALLIDEQGNVIASVSTPQNVSTPRPLWSEQDPHDWWSGIINSIKGALKEANVSPDSIAAVGLTGQMHGLVLLDENGEVLRPAILWNDGRTARQCDDIRARIGRSRLIEITGNDALTGFTAPKILWVQQQEPEIYARARHILLPKDYIRYRLTGEYAMDKADGSGTILFDLRHRNWSSEVLDVLGIPADWLPPTYEGPEITGHITPEAAGLTGLRAGTPVVGGGGDQAAQAVGVGAVESGIVALTLGTSGVVFATTPGPLIQPEGRLHAFCHAVPDRWHFMGVMLSAAGSLQWYRDTLAPGVDFDALVGAAATMPYLSGERTPHPDPLARGAWIGLTVRHHQPHLTRSVLEGVAFGLKDSFTLIQNAGLGAITQVRASGGGTKSALWRQVLADVLNAELVTVNTSEGAAYGAALCAGVAAGSYSTVDEACTATIRITGRTEPGSAGVTAYADYYPHYQALYPALRSEFAGLSALADRYPGA
jgi:xylulokinase